MDPGFEEDPDIFVVLAEGVFYQASYDGTEVAIIAYYPGILPASHVSHQEKISHARASSHCLTHCTVACSTGEAFGASRYSGGGSKEGGFGAEQGFQKEGG